MDLTIIASLRRLLAPSLGIVPPAGGIAGGFAPRTPKSNASRGKGGLGEMCASSF